MAIDQIKVDVSDLTTGMYVSRLDRPWIETPFPLQGFYVKEASHIASLRQYCKYVYIDIRRGKSPVDAVFLQSLDAPSPSQQNKKSSAGNKSGNIRVRKLRANKGVYKQTTTPRKQVKNARKMKQMAELAISYIDYAVSNHQTIPVKETREVVSRMVESIIQNPDAFIWLTKIKDKDSHLYGHAVRVTIWSISLGRHLGLSIEALNNLALGTMLADVGKIQLPDALVQKDIVEMTLEEQQTYQKHVGHALELLKGCELDKQVISVVASMHERHDGSGYPSGLVGDQIPYLAKIAGIADHYDELTFPRHHDYGLSPTDAITQLYRLVNQEFQKDLVEEFIQAIGIYPAGTLVELSTYETAMIIEQNPERRLRPKVLLLLDEEKRPYKKFKTVDLLKKETTRDGLRLEITYSLPVGSYGADPTVIYETAFASKWPLSLAG